MKAFLVQAGARTRVGIDKAALSLDDRVRVRKSPVDGDTLGYLSKGEKVRLGLGRPASQQPAKALLVKLP